MKYFTDKDIAAIAPKARRFSISCGYGLSLKVQPSGLKSWVLRLCLNARVFDIFIGHFPDISIEEARQKARFKLKEVGKEPPAGYILSDAFRLWCKAKKGRLASYDDERRRLEKYIINPLGNRQIDEISAPLIIQTVRPIEQAGHCATLKRVLMRTREIFDLAVCAGYVTHNPCERISRIFAPPVVRAMPAVDWQELPEVCRVMAKAQERLQVLFLWSLCSLLRPGEAVCVRKSWIKDAVLTMPAEVMKRRRPHRIPLPAFMLRLLAKAQELSPHPRADFVFAGSRTGTHMSAQTLAKHLHQTELSGRLVAHGLRAVGRCWMAYQGVAYEVAEACLSHVTGSQVSRAYNRSDYLMQRTKVMQDWCDYVESCAKQAGMVI